MEEADPETAEAAEADEADGTRGLVVRAVVSPEAPDTLMGLPIPVAAVTGLKVVQRPTVPTLWFVVGLPSLHQDRKIIIIIEK